MKSVGALATSIYVHTPSVVKVFPKNPKKKKNEKGPVTVMSPLKRACQRL